MRIALPVLGIVCFYLALLSFTEFDSGRLRELLTVSWLLLGLTCFVTFAFTVRRPRVDSENQQQEHKRHLRSLYTPRRARMSLKYRRQLREILRDK